MEICPTSYLPLGVLSALAQVPVTVFQRAEVPVALGADDPLIFGTRLIGQYDILRGVHGLNDQALADVVSQSVRAATAPAEVMHDFSLISPDGSVSPELRLEAARQYDHTEHSGPGMRTDRRPDLGNQAFRQHREPGLQLSD